MKKTDSGRSAGALWLRFDFGRKDGYYLTMQRSGDILFLAYISDRYTGDNDENTQKNNYKHTRLFPYSQRIYRQTGKALGQKALQRLY